MIQKILVLAFVFGSGALFGAYLVQDSLPAIEARSDKTYESAPARVTEEVSNVVEAMRLISQLPAEQRLAAITEAIRTLGPRYDLVLFLASEMNQAGDHRGALQVLLEPAAIPQTEQQESVFRSSLDVVLASYISQLQANNEVQVTAELYQSLISTFPQRTDFYLPLANALIVLGDKQGALMPLAQISQHPVLGDQARTMIREIETENNLVASGWLEVPLIVSGDQFYVDVMLDESVKAKLLVDTGAAMTVLNASVLEGLGYSMDVEQMRFVTAGGIVAAPVIEIASLKVGPVWTDELRVGALNMTFQKNMHGLLGMDWLSKFEFRIDQENQLLLLRHR